MKNIKNTILSITLVVALVFGYLHVLSNWAVGVCAEESDPAQPGVSTSVDQTTSSETTAPEDTTQPSTSVTPDDTTHPTTSTAPDDTTQPTTSTTPDDTTQPTTSTTPSDQSAYTVVFRDWDGSVISSATYSAGESIVVPEDPQRPASGGYRYTFSGWDTEVSLVCVADAEYTAQYTSTKIPKSGDNTLKKLSVNNATISPAFDPAVTNYTARVPFAVSKLDLAVAANDSKAKVSTSNPVLVAGGKTKVVITVTAEDGTFKTYNIDVTREADPNYTLSSNNNLSGIRANGFLLSPEFDPNVTEYLIWLPYETESVSITGLTQDSKASARTEGGRSLIAGADNEIRVICTAENGEEKVYTIIAKRAAAHGALPSEPTQPTTTPATLPSTTEHVCPEVSPNHVCDTGSNIPVAMVIIPWVLAFAAVIGMLVVLLLPRKKN